MGGSEMKFHLNPVEGLFLALLMGGVLWGVIITVIWLVWWWL